MNTRLKTCPYCANEYCEAEFVDNGVGNQQCGPYKCDECCAVEIGPNDYGEIQPTDNERKIGWYQGYVKHP